MLNIRRKLSLGLLFCSFTGLIVIAQKPEDYHLQSAEMLAQHKYADALTAINKAINLDSSNVEYYITRAEIAYNLKIYNKTIEDCYRILALNPDIPDVYFLRGEVCLVTNSYRGAILLFSKAIEKFTEKDKLFKSYISRGKVYANMGKHLQAVRDFLKADSLYPDSVNHLMPMAASYIKLNKLPEAEFTLEKILDRDVENVPANKLYGDIYYNRKNYEKATGFYEKYILNSPGDIEALNRLALSYMMLKKYDKAIKYCNTSLSQDAVNPETNKIRGMIYLAVDNKEEGCNCLFRALEQGYINQYGYDLLEVYIKNCENN